MRGSRGLMRGRGGNQGVEDERESGWCVVGDLMNNDLHCWRSGKGLEPAFDDLGKLQDSFVVLQRGTSNPKRTEKSISD